MGRGGTPPGEVLPEALVFNHQSMERQLIGLEAAVAVLTVVGLHPALEVTAGVALVLLVLALVPLLLALLELQIQVAAVGVVVITPYPVATADLAL